MRNINFLNKKSNKVLAEATQSLEEQIKQSDNPYLAARLEWNYLFGDIRKAKQHWQLAGIISFAANIILIIGIIIVSLQSKLIPYVVRVDQLGNALYSGFLDKDQTITPIEVNAFLRQYIINSRSVMTDAFAEKRAMDFVYSVSLPATRKILDSYYRESNPFVISKQELIEVEVQGVIQKSARTWQIDWVENHRGLDGQLLSQEHFESLITITHMTVKNNEILNTNPLGIYIQHISWARQNS